MCPKKCFVFVLGGGGVWGEGPILYCAFETSLVLLSVFPIPKLLRVKQLWFVGLVFFCCCFFSFK